MQLKNGSEVLGDLVVDATGSSSRLPQWLRESGLTDSVPCPETVTSGVCYASRRYRRPADCPEVLLFLSSCIVGLCESLFNRICLRLLQ